MKHYHFEIQAYQKKADNPKLEGDFQLLDFVAVGVIALTEEQAIEKAKLIIKRNGYRVGRVWECTEICKKPEKSYES